MKLGSELGILYSVRYSVFLVQLPADETMDFFSSPPRPVQLWGPLSLLSNRYWGLLTQGQSGRFVKLTT